MRAVGRRSQIIAALVQNSHFFPCLNGLSRDHSGCYDPGRLPHAGSHVMRPIPLFVALCNNNPSTLQTD